MRRALLIAAAAAVAILVGRLVAPLLIDRSLAACERLMEHMPDSLPPKRITADLARIRDQNEEILRILEAGRGDHTPGVLDTTA